MSAPTGTEGMEFQSVARRVASMSTLDTFLRDLKTRYPDSSVPAGPPQNGAAGQTINGVPPLTLRPNTPSATAPVPVTPPASPAAANSPLPPKVPAGVPLKPDTAPTGSITILPRGTTTLR